MKSSTDKLITPASMRSVTKLLFNKSRLSGGEIARHIKRTPNAVWLDVHKRGLTSQHAKQMAALCMVWAGELTAASQKLNKLASKADTKSTKRNSRT